MGSRLLQHQDKQEILKSVAEVGAAAAGAALNVGKEPYEALRLHELGRGVIGSLLLEIRTDIADLEEKCPELASELASIRGALDLPATSGLFVPDMISNSVAQTKLRVESEERLNEVLREIRKQSGFENFLLPPNLDDCVAATKLGPVVVISVGLYRCDAYLIEGSGVKTVELPNLQKEDIDQNVGFLKIGRYFLLSKIFEWLWDELDHPILRVLGFEEVISDRVGTVFILKYRESDL